MKLFDTHAHYNDDRFDEFDGGADAAIKASYETGVAGFINCGTDPDTSRKSIEIAQKYAGAWAAAGLHPEDCERYRDSIHDVLDDIASLLKHEKVVALGEIGLDYHWNIDRELQHKVFDIQLSIAEDSKLPVIVHDRDAHGKTLEMIKAHPGVIGVMHGFSGSAETAREYASMGWYIAFGGPVTYKNARNVKEACAAVPIDHILIETDCPYLPPVPHRGEINYSAYMHYTLAAMADVRGEIKEDLAAATVKNAERLFNIKI